MKPFPLAHYLQQVRNWERIYAVHGDLESISAANWPDFVKTLERFAKDAEDYSLLSVADQFRRMAREYEGDPKTKLSPLIEELINRLQDECNRHVVMMIEPNHVQYVNDPQFFDPTDPAINKVSVQFPSAAEDIAEAGQCFAYGRSTACVMHLARVQECGLIALAGAVGVSKQNDWGKYLAAIDAELQNRLKLSGPKNPDDQFYAEARITFDAVRRAWRNPTMHVEKTYTMERAEEIMISVRSFMRHLATKLHD